MTEPSALIKDKHIALHTLAARRYIEAVLSDDKNSVKKRQLWGIATVLLSMISSDETGNLTSQNFRGWLSNAREILEQESAQLPFGQKQVIEHSVLINETVSSATINLIGSVALASVHPCGYIKPNDFVEGLASGRLKIRTGVEIVSLPETLSEPISNLPSTEN